MHVIPNWVNQVGTSYPTEWSKLARHSLIYNRRSWHITANLAKHVDTSFLTERSMLARYSQPCPPLNRIFELIWFIVSYILSECEISTIICQNIENKVGIIGIICYRDYHFIAFRKYYILIKILIFYEKCMIPYKGMKFSGLARKISNFLLFKFHLPGKIAFSP